MRVVKGLVGLASSFTLLSSVGCTTFTPPESTALPIEPKPARAERLDRHIIKHGEYSVELDCTSDGKIEAELLKNGSRRASEEYDLNSFSRKFAKHMRNLDKLRLIPKDTRIAIVSGAQQIQGLCDGP